jgi:hypothetical protein
MTITRLILLGMAIFVVVFAFRVFGSRFLKGNFYRPTRIRMPASNARTAISGAGSASAILQVTGLGAAPGARRPGPNRTLPPPEPGSASRASPR